MKLAKKIFAILLVIAIVTTTIVVQAQELSNQLSLNTKIKTFINANSVEIMSSYFENGMKVYKVHDTENDKYYKLALDNKNEINWYDVVMYGETPKIETSLQEKMKEMGSNDKIPVIVELSFDYSSLYTQLSKKNSKYYTKSGIKSTLTESEISEAKNIKNEYIKDLMTSYNKLDSKYEVIEISEYTPFMFLNLTKSQINELKENDKVFSMGLFPELQVETALIDTSRATNAILNNNSIAATRTDLVKNDGMSGSGVKIGQIENSNPDTSNTYLSGKSIIKRTTNCLSGSLYQSTINHATEVAGILVGNTGIATNATLYSACYNSTDLIGTFASGMNWLISQNVDIINMSAWVQDTGSYNTMDRWIDAITYMNDILFVKASGNSTSPENTVTSPGLANNAITVGNIITESASYTDAVNSSRNSQSRYNTYGNNYQVNKPELVTPGTNVNYTNIYNGQVSGTSFSAPVVAGASALLMEKVPSTKNDFQSIKTALFVTARPMSGYAKQIGSSDGFPVTYYHYNNEVGLGVLDTKAAYDLLRWNQFRNFTVTGGSQDSYTFYNTLSNGRTVRVAITWSKPNTATSYSNVTNYNTDKVADLDLHILGPNGDKIVQSGSAYDNVEWVTFTTSSGYGAYQFKVVNFATNGNYVPTKVSMAWW